jgi:hypothetical protein
MDRVSTDSNDATVTLSPVMRWASIVVVWALAVLAAVLVGAFSPGTEAAAWLGISFAGCTIIALVVQLATRQKDGYIDRLAMSVTGALVVLAVATVVLGLVHIG